MENIMNSKLSFTELNRQVIKGEAGGKVFWQPRINCWLDDKLFLGQELPSPFNGLSKPDIYRELNCSDRCYYYNRCVKPVEDKRIKRYQEKIDELRTRRIIETPVVTLTTVIRANTSNPGKYEEKWLVENEEDLKVMSWVMEHTDYYWDQNEYERAFKIWGDLGLPSLFYPRVSLQNIFVDIMGVTGGIYALMDVKSHNTERLIELHNVISEGVHKIDDVEENVNSLFIALMNPEDKTNIEDVQSFSDRIEYIRIPYVMDLNTEVEIYRNIFGKHIEESFLPRVLHNFARVIIATRLNTTSEALLEWIGNPTKYQDFCDENLQLLKMEIYTGYIPSWLSEEDRKRLTAKRRRRILGESQNEGAKGISGRDSIKLFNTFYSIYFKEGRLINMSIVSKFFKGLQKKGDLKIPQGLLPSLERMYNYTVLQEVKESLYFFNEQQIARDIMNYIFAVNFEPGSQTKCRFTGDELNITEEFLSGIEARLLEGEANDYRRETFRSETQREYTSRTLPHEILIEGTPLTETKLFSDLQERYVYSLKEKVLDPFLGNENFRRAVADYDKKDFKTYDKRIRDDVTFLIGNLTTKYRYSQLGAKEVSMYVIDNYQPSPEKS
jgi:hypothetical protein